MEHNPNGMKPIQNASCAVLGEMMSIWTGFVPIGSVKKPAGEAPAGTTKTRLLTALLFAASVVFGDLVPVHDVPESLQIMPGGDSGIEIVGVFPDIAARRVLLPSMMGCPGWVWKRFRVCRLY